jgi:hypothetical protein
MAAHTITLAVDRTLTKMTMNAWAMSVAKRKAKRKAVSLGNTCCCGGGYNGKPDANECGFEGKGGRTHAGGAKRLTVLNVTGHVVVLSS